MRVLKPPHLHKHVYLLPRYKSEGNYILNTECNARATDWLASYVQSSVSCVVCRPACFKCYITYVINTEWFTLLLTRLQAGWLGGRCSIQHRVSPPYPDGLWDPPSVLSRGKCKGKK